MRWSVLSILIRRIPVVMAVVIMSSTVFAVAAHETVFSKKAYVKKKTARKKPVKAQRILAKRPLTRIRITPATIKEAQQRLSDLGYWIGAVSGKRSEPSKFGLVAFQKA